MNGMTKEEWEDVLVRSAAKVDHDLRYALGTGKLDLHGLLDFMNNVEIRQQRLKNLTAMQEIPFETIQKLFEARGPIHDKEQGHVTDRVGYDPEFTAKLNAIVPEELRIGIVEQTVIGESHAVAVREIDEAEEESFRRDRQLARRLQETIMRRLGARLADLPEANRQDTIVGIADRLIAMLLEPVA